MRILLLLCFLIPATTMGAQDAELSELPYHQIPDYPEDYAPGNVIARMIDGLGYRFYWATEGLRAEDLDYKPSEDSRTTSATLEHIYGLSSMIVNASRKQPNIRTASEDPLTFDEMRAKTLRNLKEASDLSRGKSEKEVADLAIIFQRGEDKTEFPYWNMINGPIADAIYHTGQIVAYRRAAGNPMNPKVNVFQGKNRE